MGEIKIIDILNRIVNNEPVPKRIKYKLLKKEYQELVYDEDELEYRFENDYDNFLTVPNHHLKDKVTILNWD